MKSIAIFLLLVSSATLAAAPSLPALQTQIHNLQNSIHQDHNKQSNLQQQLSRTETAMGNLSVMLQQTETKIKAVQSALAASIQEQAVNQKILDAQTKALAEESRAIYMLGRENYLEILLNQEDPAKMNRMLVYYTYINKERMRRIQAFQTTLKQITYYRNSQQAALQQLLKLKKQQQTTQKNLAWMQQKRQQVLQRLNQQIANKNQQLITLLANRSALESVLNHLQTQYLKHFHKALPHSAGKLPWPTRGTLEQAFGIAIEQSQLKTNGVLIHAEVGQPVFAVADGKVVFSKWMAGYGLLMIIDHGNGLMSIYGRNHSLYKQKGDSVKRGDLVATVGNSGGYQHSALYFALRQNGIPVDPTKWCG